MLTYLIAADSNLVHTRVFLHPSRYLRQKLPQAWRGRLMPGAVLQLE